MADHPDTHSVNAADEPHAKLVELSEVLVGTWRVDGPDIRGQAEYQTKNGGRLLVAYVDFSVGDSRMRVIQHITHDHDRGTLVARYMDTMGDRATYTWMLEDRNIRVSLGEKDSDTYFQATLNEDDSQYIGIWHYPEGGPPDAAEKIVYTRVGTAKSVASCRTRAGPTMPHPGRAPPCRAPGITPTMGRAAMQTALLITRGTPPLRLRSIRRR